MLLLLLLLLITVTHVSIVRRILQLVSIAVTVRIRKLLDRRLLVDRRTVRSKAVVTILLLPLGAHEVLLVVRHSVGVGLRILLRQGLDRGVRICRQLADQVRVLDAGASLEVEMLVGGVKPKIVESVMWQTHYLVCI